jgi:short-subunit dehydrogenase
MKIAVTGTSSGLGQALTLGLAAHSVISLTRQDLDLSDITAVNAYALPYCDVLINCAGTGLGGKRPFLDHHALAVQIIINVNLLAPMLLAQKALRQNAACKIVNITSTNNRRYWPNDLAYSLSKSSLSEFGNMLRVDYPDCRLLEVRLGLTQTRFNHNRYQDDPQCYTDIYQNPHLMPAAAADRILNAVFDDTVKFLEIAP